MHLLQIQGIADLVLYDSDLVFITFHETDYAFEWIKAFCGVDAQLGFILLFKLKGNIFL